MESSDEFIRDLSDVRLPSTGEVVRPVTGIPPWVVAWPDPSAANAATSFLRHMHSHRSDATIRSYAFDILRWLRFLDAIAVPWDEATSVEVTDFFVWMKHATKGNGSQQAGRRDPRVVRNAVTGKPYLGDKFSQASLNHNETVLFTFHEHLRARGRIMFNPVLRGRVGDPSPNAHRSPIQARSTRRRQSHRQGVAPKRLPRSISDDNYEQFFAALDRVRDRALVAMYVSSGARPSEVLGLSTTDIDMPDAIITVTRKGGRVQRLPVSWDAITWYRLYQESTYIGPGQPAWLTLREPLRPLNYDALRAMFKRANVKLGTNWSPHDLRHTAATRMLQSGASPRTVQEVLGHASLSTMQVYTVPHMDDMIAAVRARHDPQSVLAAPPSLTYDTDDLDVLFGGKAQS